MNSLTRIEAKRAAAAQARRLAMQLSGEEDRRRVLQFADELAAQAEALEKEQTDLQRHRAPVELSRPPAQQQMQQVQQAQAARADR